MDTRPDTPAEEAPATPRLPAVTERFVLHWGEMGSRWGVNRTMSQIHALLFVTGRPMNADELCEQLGVARSNVSNSLRELQGWGLVKIVHLLGDRRDHFETSGDVWELLRVIVRGRKQREFDPTIQALRDCLAHPELARSNVSNSLRELQGWGLVKIVHLLGDRRDHFETSGDVWELLRVIVRGRKQREFDPTIQALRDCLAHPELARESAVSRQRINETLVLMETTSVWVDEMLRLPPETLVKIMKLGVKIQGLLRGKAKP